jgi:hypothetical protein
MRIVGYRVEAQAIGTSNADTVSCFHFVINKSKGLIDAVSATIGHYSMAGGSYGGADCKDCFTRFYWNLSDHFVRVSLSTGGKAILTVGLYDEKRYPMFTPHK